MTTGRWWSSPTASSRATTATASERFDSAGLARAAADGRTGESPRQLADALVEAAEEANGEPLADDVALVILSTRAAAGR